MSGDRITANGPYRHGNRWRIILSHPGEGESRYRSYDTLEAAEAYVSQFRRATRQETLVDVVDRYIEELGTRCRASTVQRARYHLHSLLQLKRPRSVGALTPGAASSLYAALVATRAVDTHRNALVVGRAFGAWLVEHRHTRVNPFAAVKPVGSKRRGKPVLKIDDARRFVEVALAEQTDSGLACAMILTLGLRVSEIADRVVDDINRTPLILQIPYGKTASSVRRLEVPELLAPRLLAHIDGRARGEPLFSLSRHAIYHQVKRICDAAGVPRVCPHGLRGSAATNTVAMAVDQARRMLGHSRTRMTVSHYVAPGTIESAEAMARCEMLLGGAGNGLEKLANTNSPDGRINPVNAGYGSNSGEVESGSGAAEVVE